MWGVNYILYVIQLQPGTKKSVSKILRLIFFNS